MLFLIVDSEICVNNILVTRTARIPGGFPARIGCLRPGLLLCLRFCLALGCLLVCSGSGFPKNLLEFLRF